MKRTMIDLAAISATGGTSSDSDGKPVGMNIRPNGMNIRPKNTNGQNIRPKVPSGINIRP